MCEPGWWRRRMRRAAERAAYVLGRHVDAADEGAVLPVVKAQEGASADTKQHAAKDPLGAKVELDRLLLLEVFEDLDLGRRLPDGVPMRKTQG